MLRITSAQQDLLTRGQVGRYLAADLGQVFGEAFFSPDSGTVHYGRPDRRGRLKLDEKGRIVQNVTPLGRITSFQFDDKRLLAQQSASGVVTSFGYSDSGVLSSAQRHDKVAQSLRFDANGDLECHTLPDGGTTEFRRSERRQLVRLKDRTGGETRWDYDDEGRVTSIVNPRGYRTLFEYSGWKLPSRVQHPDGMVEEFTYGASWVERNVDGATHFRRFYDDAGRVTSTHYSGGNVVAFVYGDQGKVVRGSVGDVVTQCGYDEQGRVVVDQTGDHAFRFSYDDGRLARVAWPDGSSTSYEYDADGRLKAVVDWAGQRQEFSYGLGERPIARTLPSGLVERYEVDDVDRLKSIELGDRDGRKWSQAYGFDVMDRIAVCKDSRHGEARFEYDGGGQLRTVRRGTGGPFENFGYDAAGNRASASGRFVAYDPGDRALEDGARRHEYDSRGNRAATHGPDGVTRYIHDHRDLLVAVLHADGSRTEYEYDAFSRRIKKRRGSEVTEYVWAGHQMVLEIVSDGEKRHTREFLYWPGEHRPLAMRSGGRIFYHHCDQLGTPQVLTDATGRVVWSAVYEAYGAARIEVQEIEQPLRFVGHYFDDESGLHYNCARYYDPGLGSYISADPILPAGSFNRYRYVSGNPVNLSDPLGLFGESLPGWVRTAAGFAAGALVVGAAIALAPATLTVGAVAALAIGVGALAGATGFGVTAALTPGACVLCAIGKGALLGAIGAIPFAIAALVAGPAALGLGLVMGLGAAGGAASYAADCLIFGHPWNTAEFAKTVALSAITAGIFKIVGGKIAELSDTPPTTAPPKTDAKYPTIEMTEFGQNWGANHPVETYTPAQLEAARVVAGPDGKLVFADSGKPVNCDNGIYTMDKAGNVYVIEDPVVGQTHHSTMQKTPAGAGQISATDGQVTNLDEGTGHFGGNQPSGTVNTVANEMSSQGVDMSHTDVKPYDK